jgi:hypothetical protein
LIVANARGLLPLPWNQYGPSLPFKRKTVVMEKMSQNISQNISQAPKRARTVRKKTAPSSSQAGGKVVQMAIGCGLTCGLVGGLLGSWLFSMIGVSTVRCDELIAKTVTATRIVGQDIVAKTDEEGIACRMVDGSVVASKMVVGAHVKGNVVIGRSILASFNPTETLDKQKVAVEMAAVPKVGGTMIVRNIHGLNTPGSGPVKNGYAMFYGYADNGQPLIYAHDMAKGNKGIRPIVYAKPLSNDSNSNEGVRPAVDGAGIAQNKVVAPMPTGSLQSQKPALNTKFEQANRPNWNQSR